MDAHYPLFVSEDRQITADFAPDLTRQGKPPSRARSCWPSWGRCTWGSTVRAAGPHRRGSVGRSTIHCSGRGSSCLLHMWLFSWWCRLHYYTPPLGGARRSEVW